MSNVTNGSILIGHRKMVQSDFEAVDFGSIQHERLKIRPMYYELGFSSSPHVYGRRGVLNRIVAALDIIPLHYGVVIFDVYRTREVQGRLYEWMRSETRKNKPNLSDEDNHLETKKYMSAPSMVGDEYCPPHLSGGAIDLTLFDLEKGKEIDMGTIFDACTEVAHRDYFENKPDLTPEQIVIRNNRRILLNAMETVGFTTYQYEWWHYDLGNVFWEMATGEKAVFGPLFNDLELPY